MWLDRAAVLVNGLIGPTRPSSLDPNRPLQELGLDSLGAVELCNALSRDAGRRLPTSLVFNYPTLNALAGYLAGLHKAEAHAPRAEVVSRERLERLTEDEAEELLLRKLAILKQRGDA